MDIKIILVNYYFKITLHINIYIDVVKAMYEACIRGFYVKYYKNNDANQKSDAWCFLFDYKDFKVIYHQNS